MLTGCVIIGGVGLGLLLVSLVIGEVFHGVIDAVIPGDVISGAAVAAFLAALGFVGAIVYSQTEHAVAATAAGVTVGLAALATWATRALMRGDTDHNVRTAGMIGLHGTVVSDSPQTGYGQVSVVAEGHITRLNAVCDVALAAGRPITVIDALSPTSVRVIARGPVLPGTPTT